MNPEQHATAMSVEQSDPARVAEPEGVLLAMRSRSRISA